MATLAVNQTWTLKATLDLSIILGEGRLCELDASQPPLRTHARRASPLSSLSLVCRGALTDACCVWKGQAQRKPFDASAPSKGEHRITSQGRLSDVSGQQALQKLSKVRKCVRVYSPTQSSPSRIFPWGKGEQGWIWGVPPKEFHSWDSISGARSKSSKMITPSPPSTCQHFPFQPADKKRNRQGDILNARRERPSVSHKEGDLTMSPTLTPDPVGAGSAPHRRPPLTLAS